MRISEVFITTIKIIKLYSQEHPEAQFMTDGKSIKATELLDPLNKLLGWLYKDLTSESIERITRCRDCRYYKKYKKKGDIKAAPFYACSHDKQRRRPDFFCKDGER